MRHDMNIETLSENLKLYRSKKRFTQQDLAEHSGVSLPAIKNIERKKGTPRTNTLLELSKALDCRLQDLVKPVKILSSVRFRARKKMNKRQEVLSQVAQWLNNFVYLENLLSDKILYKFNNLPTALNPKELARKAREILELKPNEPIHDICGLIEHAGIKVLALPYSSDAFNGLSVGAEDQGPAVIINTWDRITIERQIFSAAHELGHLLMHLGDYNGEPLAEDKKQESEADTFASYFLMPETGFDDEWKDTAGMSFIDRIMKLKSIFKVSYATVLFRLKEKNVVDDHIWANFKIMFKRRYNRPLSNKEEPFPETHEPFGLKPFDFFADRYVRLVREAVEKELVSISKAAELMNFSSEQMLERISEWENIG